MLKDASDDEDDGDIAAVQSPIFDHPQFERIEAEGHAANADYLNAAAEALRAVKRRMKE